MFLDFPLDVVFMEADADEAPEVHAPRAEQADGAALDRAVALFADAERPVIMAGTNLYWGHGEDALRELAERRGIPVFLNGLGARMPARGPRAGVRAGAQDRARGGRRRAGHRRADGLPARLRQGVR